MRHKLMHSVPVIYNDGKQNMRFKVTQIKLDLYGQTRMSKQVKINFQKYIVYI